MTTLGAAATIVGLVGGLAGLYAAILQPYVKRPRLRILAYDPAAGDCATSRGTDSGDTWVRLRVVNEHRDTMAESVQVVIALIDDFGRPRDGLQDLHLNEDRALRWADRSDIAVSIPAKMPRRCDLVRIKDGIPYPELTFHDAPDDRRQALLPGAYAVTLCVMATNARPIFQRVQLTIPADWRPGEPLGASQVQVDRRVAHALPARPSTQ